MAEFILILLALLVFKETRVVAFVIIGIWLLYTIVLRV